MADENHGEAQFLLEVPEEFQGLGLDDHIQCGARLVRDEKSRIRSEGHGYERSLAHPTAELVRIVINSVRFNAHQLQKAPGSFKRVLLLDIWLVDSDSLNDLVSDFEDRIESVHCALKYNGYAFPANLAH